MIAAVAILTVCAILAAVSPALLVILAHRRLQARLRWRMAVAQAQSDEAAERVHRD